MTIAYGGTSLCTTAPAPITAPSPIVRTVASTIALWPIHTSLPIDSAVLTTGFSRTRPKHGLKNSPLVARVATGWLCVMVRAVSAIEL